MTPSRDPRSGFTLIELLLYVTLAGVLLGAVSLLLVQSYSARIRSQVIAEVDDQGAAALSLIQQSVRSGASITAPTTGSSSTLRVTTATGTTGPLVFDVASGSLRLAAGTSTPVALTNGDVTVTGLTFTAGGASTTPGSVAIRFTVGYLASSTRQIYDYTRTFYGAATARYR